MNFVTVGPRQIALENVAWTEHATKRRIADSGLAITMNVLQVHFIGGGGLELTGPDVAALDAALNQTNEEVRT